MIEMVRYVEKWALIQIEDVKPHYYISTFGRIYSIATTQFIIPHKTETGYLQVSLMTYTGRIFRKVHRLVLLAFEYFPGCELLQVNHKNCNKEDNSIWNLEWVTPKENIAHAINNNRRSSVGENNVMATITNQQALQISELILRHYSNNDISKIIGCSASVVSEIAFGRTWTHLFSDEIRENMLRTRTGHYMPDDIKHKICLYFANNKSKNVSELCKNAIINSGFELTDRSFRLAKRLYYRYQDDNITKYYNY